ncbi:hypothetical protein CISG_03444 [Coccidioides immitis RMSCC 3703]|uniref:Uncharacterized protein n=1 Tax=Coccidioides immitis RMSCC 3703 TaxID=454286 RepID=A0A0J8QLA7_COCIT|nr:hypothetical protein CISG_03444 [Coccidioides immitis RMSCC 3703]
MSLLPLVWQHRFCFFSTKEVGSLVQWQDKLDHIILFNTIRSPYIDGFTAQMPPLALAAGGQNRGNTTYITYFSQPSDAPVHLASARKEQVFGPPSRTQAMLGLQPPYLVNTTISHAFPNLLQGLIRRFGRILRYMEIDLSLRQPVTLLVSCHSVAIGADKHIKSARPMCPCHKGYSIKGRLGSEQRGLDVCLMPRGGQLEKYPPAPPFPRSQDRKRNHKLNQYLESALRNVAAVFVQELNGLRMPSIPSSMPQEGLKGTMSWHHSGNLYEPNCGTGSLP